MGLANGIIVLYAWDFMKLCDSTLRDYTHNTFHTPKCAINARARIPSSWFHIRRHGQCCKYIGYNMHLCIWWKKNVFLRCAHICTYIWVTVMTLVIVYGLKIKMFDIITFCGGGDGFFVLLLSALVFILLLTFIWHHLYGFAWHCVCVCVLFMDLRFCRSYVSTTQIKVHNLMHIYIDAALYIFPTKF